jgi:DNA-binding transcriptional LysR family regulator
MKDTVSLDGLRVFLAAYRTGSFSRAAVDLGTSQASVSGQIASLERHLGQPLFDRSPTGARATDAGRELAERVAGALDQLVQATDDAVARDALSERTVVLAGPTEFLSEVVLPRLAKRLPSRVRLRVRFGSADELADALGAGAVDLLVSTVPLRRAGIATMPIADEEFVLVAHPKWLGSEANLEAIPLLAYAEDLPLIKRYWRTVFERKPTDLDVHVVAPDLRVLARLAAAGEGMTVLPTYPANPYLEARTLVRLVEPEVPPLNTLFLAWRRTAGRPDPGLEDARAAIVEAGREPEIPRLRAE